jgi:hypothetical protein
MILQITTDLLWTRPGGGNSNGGNVFVSGGGSRNADAPRATPLVSLTPEHYGRIVRIL